MVIQEETVDDVYALKTVYIHIERLVEILQSNRWDVQNYLPYMFPVFTNERFVQDKIFILNIGFDLVYLCVAVCVSVEYHSLFFFFFCQGYMFVKSHESMI